MIRFVRITATTLWILVAELAVHLQGAGVPAGEPFSIRWITNSSPPQRASVSVLGLSSETLENLKSSGRYSQVLTVHTSPSGPSPLPAMAGTYRQEGNVLHFEPLFPLTPGVSYTAILRVEEAATNRPARMIRATFQVPAHHENATTIVTSICPTAEVVPENLLKFYVHFSAPMSRGHIYDHIHLRNEAGKEVELPFLEIDEELWDPSMSRLTLLLDPGRIKRGVRPLEEVGPALEEGKRYLLVIDKAWKDGAGDPLKLPFQKQFRVGPADRDPPKPNDWKIESPRSGTREPMRIDFGKPMDEALAQRTIQVLTSTEQPVAGAVQLKDQERTWAFTPERAWSPGIYKISVGTTIEDLAGNNIGKPFDVDLFERIDRDLIRPKVELRLQVR